MIGYRPASTWTMARRRPMEYRRKVDAATRFSDDGTPSIVHHMPPYLTWPDLIRYDPIWTDSQQTNTYYSILTSRGCHLGHVNQIIGFNQTLCLPDICQLTGYLGNKLSKRTIQLFCIASPELMANYRLHVRVGVDNAVMTHKIHKIHKIRRTVLYQLGKHIIETETDKSFQSYPRTRVWMIWQNISWYYSMTNLQ